MKVVYIMGAGRSGSTVLDTVLGNHPRVESLGELSALPEAAWVRNGFCACGERAAQCPFWSSVHSKWKPRGGDVARHLELRSRYETTRAWPRLVAARALRTAGWRAWAESTRELLGAILGASGKEVLVDSSKSPARAWGLAGLEGVEVFLVHLVRDGRAVAWSLSKAHARDERAGVQRELRPRSVLRSALFWSAVNAQADWVRRRHPAGRTLLMRYEDCLDDLPGALSPLASFLGEPTDELAAEAAAGRELSVGHTIAGNRLRMSGKVRLARDDGWRSQMPERQRELFWRIAGRRMRRYGYAP